MMAEQATGQSSQAPFSSKAKLSCANCGHLKVCLIFRTFNQCHKQVFPEETEPAFNAEDLANICREFKSKTLMELAIPNEETETAN